MTETEALRAIAHAVSTYRKMRTKYGTESFQVVYSLDRVMTRHQEWVDIADAEHVPAAHGFGASNPWEES